MHHTEKNGQTGQLLMHSDRVEKGKSKCRMVKNDLLEFIDGLQVMVTLCVRVVTLYSCCNRDGNIFRVDLSHRKNLWCDWDVVDWHRDGKLPNQIYGFVDLRLLPDNLTQSDRVNHGGLMNIKPAMHAIVEATAEICEGVAASELFEVLSTEVSDFEDGSVTKIEVLFG